VFRSYAGFVVLVAFWAACKEDSEGNANGNLTPATHGLSGTPSGPKSRLYLPLESSIRLSDAASAPRPDVLLFRLSHLPALSNLEDLRTGSWCPSPVAGPLLPAFHAYLDAPSGKMKERE